MCHLYPYNNVKLLRKFFYINIAYITALWHGSFMLTVGIATCLLPGLCKVSNAFYHIYSDSSSDMNKHKIYYTTIILK